MPAPIERGGRRLRSADSSRQHLRHARGGRVPARLHAERAVLRHRDAIDHRLRRRPRRHPRAGSSAASASRRSAFRRIRCACCARSRWRPGSTSESTTADSPGDRPLSRRARTQRAGAPDGGDLQSAARGCGRKDIPHAGRDRIARGARARSAGPHHGPHSGSHWQRSTTTAARSSAIPKSLGNAILLGSLLIPLGLLDQHHGRTKELGARFGILPLARRDVEFLRQILILQRHLRDPNASPRHRRGIMHRAAFPGCAHVARASRQRPGARRVLARAAEQTRPTRDAADGADDLPPASDAPPRRRRRRRTAQAASIWWWSDRTLSDQ